MNKYLSTPTAQAIIAALGRGMVTAIMAFGYMLIAHVTDHQKILGWMIVLTFLPLAGLLHLVVPAIPGVPTALAARMWPRLGQRPDAPPPLAPPDPQEWTQPRSLTDIQRIAADDAYRNRPPDPYTQKSGWQQPPQR